MQRQIAVAQLLLSILPMPLPRTTASACARIVTGLALFVSLVVRVQAEPAVSPAEQKPSPHGYAYIHDEVREVPWSVHIFRFERSRHDLFIGNTLGNKDAIGMRTVSEQMKSLPPEAGIPLAAINGDFYNNDRYYPGDPRDLQIHQGELVSAPSGHACFWVNPAGEPQSTNVTSSFRVVWPNGSTTPFGLNEAREKDAAVLYTAVNGPSTRTRGGRELILEPTGKGPLLPLRVGQTLQAKVREVREDGDSPLTKDTVVLSLGYKLASRMPAIAPGTTITLITETVPSLAGVNTAVGGGPTLVRDGKTMEWSGFLMRHPRTAIGWNKEHIFLVEVDGRQSGLSVGMTLPEIAAYMLKLGCEQAMNLDGGGSATMWVCGNVMNSPSEGQERPGANTLVVFHRAEQAQAKRAP
jgi:hypothetical protein